MPAFKKPTGRPPALRRVLSKRPDGTEVTIADTIVDAVRAGCFIETAASAAGVDRTTLQDWLRTGARVNAKLNNDGARRADFTRKERDCAEFSLAVSQAFAQATAIEVVTASQLARGGLEQTETTTRTETGPAGVKTVTSTKTTKLAPDGAMIRWRLSKREPDTWGVERLELTGAEGGPIELSLQEKRERVLATLDGLAARLTTPDPTLQLVPAPPHEENP